MNKLSLALFFVLICAARPVHGAHTDVDKQTGMEVHYVTDEPCINTTAYPTCQTWSADSRYLFIESTRHRPDGTVLPGERQLLKVDIKTGEAIHLVSLEVEKTGQYGAAQIPTSTEYHFDYSPQKNVLVYYDMAGHNMYLLDVATGRSGRILHEDKGTLGDPPAISRDGRKVVYYALIPSKKDHSLSGITSVISALDIDPVKLTAIGEPKTVTSLPGSTPKGMKGSLPYGVLANHCQIDPKDSNHYLYSHEFGRITPDGSPALSRLWENRGGADKPICTPQKKEWQTHEVIGPLGKSLYFVENWGVSAFDFQTGAKTRIYDDQKLKPCHITLSPDEKWIAADMFDGVRPDKDGCYQSGILLIEGATHKSRILCRTLRGARHPRHPHPNFSPDGTKIAFTIADAKNTSQVAYVDVMDVIKNWK
jgi:Tol biopolymer transport system component